MYFDSLQELLAMGGHGLYVWLAYGVFLMVIVWNLVAPLIQRQQVLKSVARHWRRVDMHQTDEGDQSSQD